MSLRLFRPNSEADSTTFNVSMRHSTTATEQRSRSMAAIAYSCREPLFWALRKGRLCLHSNRYRAKERFPHAGNFSLFGYSHWHSLTRLSRERADSSRRSQAHSLKLRINSFAPSHHKRSTLIAGTSASGMTRSRKLPGEEYAATTGQQILLTIEHIGDRRAADISS